MAWYLNTGQAGTLSELAAYELKRYIGELRDQDLADNAIHGFLRYSEHSPAGGLPRRSGPASRASTQRLLRRRWRPTLLSR